MKNIGLLARLNPYAAVQKRQTLLTQLKGRRTGTTAETKVRTNFPFSFLFYIFVFKAAARKARSHASLRAKRLSGVNLVKKTKTSTTKTGKQATKTTSKTTVKSS